MSDMDYLPGDIVTVEYDEGQHLLRRTTGKRAVVVKQVRCFVVLMIDDVGQRSSIVDYVQHRVTPNALAARFGEIEV